MTQFFKRMGCISLIISMASMPVFAESQPSQSELDAEEERSIKLILGAGLSFGGDDLIKAEFENGWDEEIDAGSGYDLRIGAAYQPRNSSYSVQATIGFFRDDINAKNGDASFTRYPLELLGFYHITKHRFGLGIARYSGNKLKIDIEGDSGSTSFDDATGVVVQYGYQYNDKLSFAVRAAQAEYENETFRGINGDHIGVFTYFSL